MPQPSGADDPALAQFAAWLAQQPEGRACTAAKLRRHGGRIYAACGREGVFVVVPGPQPRIHSRIDLGGFVFDVIEYDGRLLALVQKTETHVVAGPELPQLSPTPPLLPHFDEGAPTATPRPRVKRRRRTLGRVVETRDTGVVIDLGRTDGLELESRIALSAAGEEIDEVSVPLAIGVVRGLGPHRAFVRLGMNEAVSERAVARRTNARLTSSRTGPARPRSSYWFSAMLRPFLSLDSDGWGFLLDAAVGYRFPSALHVRAVVEPLAFANDGETLSTLTGFGMISYDTKLFEGGIGLGYQDVAAPDTGVPGSGTVVPYYVRLGATDGLHAAARVDLTLLRREFEFTAFRIDCQIPIGDGDWLILRGGGGPTGYALGEVGLRRLLTGNGGPGSSFLTLTTGGEGVTNDDCADNAECFGARTISGVHVGGGIETRF